jgi:hypothetical protein
MAADNEGLSPLTIGVIILTLAIIAGIFYFGIKSTSEQTPVSENTGMTTNTDVTEEDVYDDENIRVIGEPEYIEDEKDLPPKNALHLKEKGEKSPPAIF